MSRPHLPPLLLLLLLATGCAMEPYEDDDSTVVPYDTGEPVRGPERYVLVAAAGINETSMDGSGVVIYDRLAGEDDGPACWIPTDDCLNPVWDTWLCPGGICTLRHRPNLAGEEDPDYSPNNPIDSHVVVMGPMGQEVLSFDMPFAHHSCAAVGVDTLCVGGEFVEGPSGETAVADILILGGPDHSPEVVFHSADVLPVGPDTSESWELFGTYGAGRFDWSHGNAVRWFPAAGDHGIALLTLAGLPAIIAVDLDGEVQFVITGDDGLVEYLEAASAHASRPFHVFSGGALTLPHGSTLTLIDDDPLVFRITLLNNNTPSPSWIQEYEVDLRGGEIEIFAPIVPEPFSAMIMGGAVRTEDDHIVLSQGVAIGGAEVVEYDTELERVWSDDAPGGRALGAPRAYWEDEFAGGLVDECAGRR